MLEWFSRKRLHNSYTNRRFGDVCTRTFPMAEHHELMGGKLHVYKRENSSYWQCSAYLGGRNHRVSTKEESLAHAKEFAEDWYLELRGKARAGMLKTGKTFRFAAKHFLAEYVALIAAERNALYVKSYEWKLRVHLI